MFSALRPGSSIYILNRDGDLSLKVGIVDQVSTVRPMYKTFNPAVSFSTNMQMVVDITVTAEDQKLTFEGVPSNLSVHSNGNYTISENREAMISEVDALL